MDKNFIKRATSISSFNLTTHDFESLKYKKEIQYLFNFYFFPKFDLNNTVNDIEINKLNRVIDMLKREDNNMFEKLHSYNLKGVGPGEATLYFICNSAHLGGGGSAGIDIVASNGKFEVKAARITEKGEARNFKLGGTVPLAEIMQGMNYLRGELKLPGNAGNISGGVLQQIKQKAPVEYSKVEDLYKDAAYDYFKDHKVIFINQNSGRQVRGRVQAIKNVKRDDICIDEITSGTVKPRIKL